MVGVGVGGRYVGGRVVVPVNADVAAGEQTGSCPWSGGWGVIDGALAQREAGSRQADGQSQMHRHFARSLDAPSITLHVPSPRSPDPPFLHPCTQLTPAQWSGLAVVNVTLPIDPVTLPAHFRVGGRVVAEVSFATLCRGEQRALEDLFREQLPTHLDMDVERVTVDLAEFTEPPAPETDQGLVALVATAAAVGALLLGVAVYWFLVYQPRVQEREWQEAQRAQSGGYRSLFDAPPPPSGGEGAPHSRSNGKEA